MLMLTVIMMNSIWKCEILSHIILDCQKIINEKDKTKVSFIRSWKTFMQFACHDHDDEYHVDGLSLSSCISVDN